MNRLSASASDGADGHQEREERAGENGPVKRSRRSSGIDRVLGWWLVLQVGSRVGGVTSARAIPLRRATARLRHRRGPRGYSHLLLVQESPAQQVSTTEHDAPLVPQAAQKPPP